MSAPLPVVYLARHGETAWSVSRRHTGRTDLPLTPAGERDGLALGARLRGTRFALVLTSPLQRASRTCALAGFGEAAVPDADLVEWHYGDYEGLRTTEIRARRPDWDIFRDGCPGGEDAHDIGARADRVVARMRAAGGDVLVFSSAHILRVLAARWLGLAPADARYFVLGTGSLSALSYEHGLDEPVVQSWNEATAVRP
jgi:probable phosphoglycerate mutase